MDPDIRYARSGGGGGAGPEGAQRPRAAGEAPQLASRDQFASERSRERRREAPEDGIREPPALGQHDEDPLLEERVERHLARRAGPGRGAPAIDRLRESAIGRLEAGGERRRPARNRRADLRRGWATRDHERGEHATIKEETLAGWHGMESKKRPRSDLR
jgi:hypothetical protein